MDPLVLQDELFFCQQETVKIREDLAFKEKEILKLLSERDMFSLRANTLLKKEAVSSLFLNEYASNIKSLASEKETVKSQLARIIREKDDQNIEIRRLKQKLAQVKPAALKAASAVAQAKIERVRFGAARTIESVRFEAEKSHLTVLDEMDELKEAIDKKDLIINKKEQAISKISSEAVAKTEIERIRYGAAKTIEAVRFDSEKARQALVNEIDRLKRALDEKNLEFARMSSECENRSTLLQKEIATRKMPAAERNNALTQQIAELNNALLKAQEELKAKTNLAAAAAREQERLASLLNEEKNSKQSVEKTILQLQKKAGDSDTLFQQKLKAATEPLTKKLATAEKDLKQSKEENLKLSAAKADSVVEFSRQLAALKQDLAEQKSATREQLELVNKLKQENAKTEKEHKTLLEEKADLERTVNRLTTELKNKNTPAKTNVPAGK